MDQRHDALLSAARFIEKVNQVVTSEPGAQVGTVGWLKVEPGAYNVIPGKVVLGLEVRDLSEEKFVGLFHRIQSDAEALGKLNQTRFSFTEPVVVHPSLTDNGMGKLIDDGVLAGAAVITIPVGGPTLEGDREGGIETCGEEKPGPVAPLRFSPTPAAKILPSLSMARAVISFFGAL